MNAIASTKAASGAKWRASSPSLSEARQAAREAVAENALDGDPVRLGARDVLARGLFLRDGADLARGQYLGERWAEQALAIWRDLGNLPWQARALNQLGMRAYFEGRWDDALSYYRQAADAHERTGGQWNASRRHWCMPDGPRKP